MNWQKVDASLAAAISGSATSFNFFVRTFLPITQRQETTLRALGCNGCFVGKKIITVRNGSQQLIDRLSNLKWVSAIEHSGSVRLSQR